MVNPHVRGAPCRDMGSEWARMGPNGPEWALPNRVNGPTVEVASRGGGGEWLRGGGRAGGRGGHGGWAGGCGMQLILLVCPPNQILRRNLPLSVSV